MPKHALPLLLVACLFAGTLWAADDPFVGKWKLNPSKSKLTGEMKVEGVGGSKYAFDLGGGTAETIAADGTDQPGFRGTTLSVSILGQDNRKVVRKKDGRVLLTANWRLSPDANTLTDDFTGVQPKGATVFPLSCHPV